MYIIIGGGGDIGYYLTKTLLSQGHEVLLLEKNSGRAQSLSEELGQAVMRGDACEARTLGEVGANRADVIIAVTGEDEDNLVICQMAKRRFNVGRTIARLNNPKHEQIFQKLGIDSTVSPTRTILSLIELELSSANFVPIMTLKRAGLDVIEMRISPDSPVAGKFLRQVNLPTNSSVILIIRDKQHIFPSAETRILTEDEVYALVGTDDEEDLRKALGATS